ncbi:protein-disulfide reductase DsbD family protein [Flavobacterium aquatile]|uniref:Thiol:disulfide interchange protein DsbD n=1 Tax=Flavobacterium aquatile LMG 4008 = ATCC 11947 TaxID=1453498 RepID=A0A095TWT3_9FLAO|nr:cytochrome c biogenesis protein CcdA [Flavobacterium aquatile]KGD66833.1 thiol:disulfide interchange protein DsbD [Flavobacterium aquatile LMG 4008 = ATCC 11947]OXA67928.1 thiol:disulfide interchange protein [Flavobacterium aquatile LMG 4008 = ATCC 11947]GEC78661.1 thiol:disulfide interchange protein DsbD [Flavobacterium aquatile]
MRNFLYTLITFLVLTNVNAQVLSPVKWTTKIEKVSETEFNLIASGTIQEGWHVFSQFTPDGGSLPMVLNFKDIKGNYELVGKAKESPYQKVYSDVFEVDEYIFEDKVTVTQKVKITNPKTTKIKLNLEYQVCKEACINDSKDLVFNIPLVSSVVETTVSKDTIVELDSQFATTVDTSNTPTTIKQAEPKSIEPIKDEKSLWTIFFLAFLGGFAALLMPCIFPMIPMTVSFFTKQSKSKAQGIRNAIIYGLSIIAIYVILGSLITGIFGAEALNELSTSVAFNLIFFALLVIFALSFLGAFEIMLPSSWATKLDSKADKGGIIGIIFMALALAVVSFSCTGPIVGTLLVESASKGGIAPVVGMLGFSLAIALPFMLFAMFPGWLNSLPKSGGWLNTVKVSLGFLELAFAFKFLSNADLVLQKHLLERELFIAIWIAIFGAWALYLFGKYMLPHDYEKADKIGVGRLMMALVVTTFTFYMIPGLWGAPLKILSGLTPPIHYAESTNGFGSSNSNKSELPEHAHFGPHGIIAFEDYDLGLAYAKKVNKPVLLDFTGDACANCRKMEDNVWSDPAVLKILKNDVVLISLYCDRKIDLPKDKQYVSKTTGKEVVTIGNKWTDFQITRYKSNSQPLYVILDADGNDLSKPIAFTFDKQEYKKWLEDGISLYKK